MANLTRKRLQLARLLMAVSLCAAGSQIVPMPQPSPESRGCRFIACRDFSDWILSTNLPADAARQTKVLTSPLLNPRMEWDELVVSWNVPLPPCAGLTVEAQAGDGEWTTRFFSLGHWSVDANPFPRESVPGQQDADGEVQTDLLKLSRPASLARIRLLFHSDAEPRTVLSFVGVSFRASCHQPFPLPPLETVSRLLPVETLCQLDYPGGDGWCSPTSVAMALRYWSARLGRPELMKSVPEVARGVDDRNWPGTGNWSFNAAYAGIQPGLEASVARWSDISEIEQWLAIDVPIIASVSYGLLKGLPRGDDGHLVVCVGRTPEGDLIVNDPGSRVQPQRQVPRADFWRAWSASGGTVYLIHPEGWRVPEDRFGHWDD